MLALKGGDKEAEDDEDSDAQDKEEAKTEYKTGLGVKVRSGSNLAAMAIEQENARKGRDVDAQVKKDLNPEYGFDLSKIRSHYENRRMIRQSKMVLRYGELSPLIAKNETTKDMEWLNSVLAYARYSLMETAIVATNLTDQAQRFYIDASRLSKFFNEMMGENSVIIARDLLD